MADLLDAADLFVSRVGGLFPRPRPKVFRNFDYADAVRWFTHNQPPDFHVNGGVLVRRSSSRGWLMAQAFVLIETTNQRFELVEGADGAVQGRKFVVRRVGTELDEAFAGRDVLFFT